MEKEWIELRERPDMIDLPGDSKRTASNYIEWLYTGQISVEPYVARGQTHEIRAKESERIYALLAEAYTIGEKVSDIKYKNAVVKALIAAIKSSGWSPGPAVVDTIYRGTPPTSPLRCLIADIVASSACDDSVIGGTWMQFFDEIPKGPLVEAIKATVRVRPFSRNLILRSTASYLEEE